MPAVRLVPAEGADLQRVLGLLRAHDLPHGDVEGGPGRFFLAVDGDDTVGCGGLERHGESTLLRSVVTVPERRGQRYGRSLVRALLCEAHDAGTREAWLLTTTAVPFFADLGFERVDRETAPPPIRESHEFAEACPDSATCMRRSLPVGE